MIRENRLVLANLILDPTWYRRDIGSNNRGLPNVMTLDDTNDLEKCQEHFATKSIEGDSHYCLKLRTMKVKQMMMMIPIASMILVMTLYIVAPTMMISYISQLY